MLLRSRLLCAARLFAVTVVLFSAWMAPLQAAGESSPDCAGSDDAAAGAPGGCTGSGLSPFQQNQESAPASPSEGANLRTYDTGANAPRRMNSPGDALTSMPSIFVRVMRWMATAMIMLGVTMIAARKWMQQRIRRADEAATVAARRMLGASEQVRLSPAPARPPPRRIQWTAERIGALDDKGYARLCAGYWETQGYTATLANAETAGGFLIQLRRPPDRKLLGLVRCVMRDDGPTGMEAVRRLVDERHHGDISMAAIMTRAPLSEQALALATQHALQTMDESTLLGQLRTLTQDQQEALLAELDALTPSSSRGSLGSSIT